MLCQPDSYKSCGACCGLYNWKDHTRAALEAILSLQTNLFFAHSSPATVRNLRQERNRLIANTPLFETIYNCEYLGFLDGTRRRVGCLLHPAVTGNHSLRNLCFYGSKICNEHFCPSFGCLTTAEQQAVVLSVDDWYLYGLVITDIDLVKYFFKHIEERLGESIRPSRLLSPAAITALSNFFRLKTCWKFKAHDNRLGKYFFSETEYHIARIDYQNRWGIPASRFDKILVSLESDFSNERELHEAERIIDDYVQGFVNAYEKQTVSKSLTC